MTEVLLRHGGFVRALARALLRDENAAEDVAQDAWMQWLRRAPGDTAPRGWLARAVRHLAANRRRSEERRARHEALGAAPEPVRSPSDEAEQEELLHRVVKAVYELDEPYRATLLARYFRGLDARAVARETATPVATVRSREQRALELIRKKLDREHDGRAAWALVLSRAAIGSGPTSIVLVPVAAGAAMLATVAMWFAWAREAEHDPVAPVEAAASAGPDARVAEPDAPRPSREQLPALPASEPGASEANLAPEADTGPAPLLGACVDTDGHPLAGVRVLFRGVDRRETLAETRSDGNGRFRVEGLAGFHDVVAELEGHAFLHATDPAGDGLEPWHSMRITLAPLARLEVRVHDTRGAPFEGVSVEVRARGEEYQDTSSSTASLARPWESIDGFTGADGLVELAVWTGVRLIVSIDLEDGADSGEVESDRHREGTLVLDGSEALPIVLRPGGVLALTATWDAESTLRGRTLDTAGQPLADCTVELVDEGYVHHAKGWELGEARSGDDGAFELTYRAFARRGPLVLRAFVFGREYVIGLGAPRPSSTVRVPALAGEHALESTGVEARDPIEIVLSPNGEEVLGGILSDARGGGLANSSLLLLAHGSSRFESPRTNHVYSGDGGFLVFGLAPGLYDLALTSRDALSRFRAMGEPAFTVFPRLAAGREDLDLRLPRSASVSIEVHGESLRSLTLGRFFPRDPARFPRTRAPSAQLLQEWSAQASPAEDGTWLTTQLEAGDSRSLALSLGEPGWYRIEVACAGAVPVSTELLFFAPGEHVLDARPPPASATLSGRLLADGARGFYGLILADGRGRPLPVGAGGDDARVHILPIKANGEFLLRELAPGPCRLRFGSIDALEDGSFGREVVLELVAGENPPLEVPL